MSSPDPILSLVSVPTLTSGVIILQYCINTYVKLKLGGYFARSHWIPAQT
jgi:hypothetical protein